MPKPGRWRLLDTGLGSAEENMALDVKLLEDLATTPSDHAVLHLYDWEGMCATYGYFIDPDTLLCRQAVAKRGLQLARRPTGGGIIFHVADLAFSVLVPAGHPGYSVNTLDNYAYINALVVRVVKSFSGENADLFLLPAEPVPLDAHARHFCMAKPTKYDVMLSGRKVGGGAQRRTRHGFLHQGTISLALPDEQLLQEVLLPGTAVLAAMRLNTCALLCGTPSAQAISEARQSLKDIFQNQLKDSF